MEADENLLRVIPNFLEFGTADHSLHILISAAFLIAAYVWKKRRDVTGRSNIVVSEGRMGRSTKSEDVSNYDRNLKDASLGRSDVNRRDDLNRRTDFENRI